MLSHCQVLARGSRLSASSSAPHADPAFDAYDDISGQQAAIALIAEMIHVASLVHDDVIDEVYGRGKEYGREYRLTISSSLLFLVCVDRVHTTSVFSASSKYQQLASCKFHARYMSSNLGQPSMGGEKNNKKHTKNKKNNNC